MSKWNPIISIDIGNDTLKGIVVNNRQDGKEVVAYSVVKSRGIELGDIKDVVALNDSMNVLLDNLEEQVGKVLKGDFVVSSSCGNYELKDVKREMILSEDDAILVNERHLEDLKSNLLADIVGDNNIVFHIYTKRYIIDERKIVFNPVDMYASKVGAVFSIILGDSIHRSIVDYATRETIGDAEYYISPVSEAEAVLTNMEKDRGVMHIDLGHFSTVVTVFLNGAPVMLVRVPVAIRQVILDIARVLRTSIYEAERLLKIHGIAVFNSIEPALIEYKALDGRTSLETDKIRLARIIHARLREVFMKVRRVYREAVITFEEFKDLGIPGGVVLSGGGANIPRVTDVAADILKCPVRVGGLAFIEDYFIEENENVLVDPIFAAAFGNIISYEKSEGKLQYTGYKKTGNSLSLSEKIASLFRKLF
ncbi:cell division protein FtsA [Thermosipho ferrireducens]|uniref:Cell division protein FtsA n=1 Tax=Thermosipho ferrireducens TaxID=2571116 RepID=A0ABX7S809_9BACT|nr:cell division FtsA domain-containing protein [Thermosipho ferrireducens]QTA37245.1 cell division protein FtsA [Thermosipho ferrireducens]